MAYEQIRDDEGASISALDNYLLEHFYRDSTQPIVAGNTVIAEELNRRPQS